MTKRFFTATTKFTLISRRMCGVKDHIASHVARRGGRASVRRAVEFGVGLALAAQSGPPRRPPLERGDVLVAAPGLSEGKFDEQRGVAPYREGLRAVGLRPVGLPSRSGSRRALALGLGLVDDHWLDLRGAGGRLVGRMAQRRHVVVLLVREGDGVLLIRRGGR